MERETKRVVGGGQHYGRQSQLSGVSVSDTRSRGLVRIRGVNQH